LQYLAIAHNDLLLLKVDSLIPRGEKILLKPPTALVVGLGVSQWYQVEHNNVISCCLDANHGGYTKWSREAADHIVKAEFCKKNSTTG
jgi:hypothetical protein